MKFTQETAGSNHTITAHSKNSISVDTLSFDRSLILLPDEILENWGATKFSDISIASFEALADKSAEIVLIGTGDAHRIPDVAIMSYFLQQNIGCEAMTTAAACRTYNLLVNEDRRVAACLLLEN